MRTFQLSKPPFFRSVFFTLLSLLLPLLLAVPFAPAQSCTTQAEMDAGTRNKLENAALFMARQVSADKAPANTPAIQASIAPQVASQAAGILASVASAAGKVQGAAFTVRNLYILDASSGAANQSTQFFCGSMNLPPHVVFTLGGLQPGKYGIAIVEATSIARPQQMTIIFEQSPLAAEWKLAGFSYKPSTMAGHNGDWYWKQARMYAQKKENWNSYFYYKTARFLLVPVDFLSSSNLDKLLREEHAVKPAGLPGASPMPLTGGNQSFSVTDLHTDSFSGGLDLVIRYTTKSVQDPVATRRDNIAVMHLLLQAHPELRQAFHGLWVYAVAPGQDPFGIELPMDQIP